MKSLPWAIGLCLGTELLVARAQTSPTKTNTTGVIARIRDEGLNRSEVMPTLTYLTEVIGPRLTGSPNLKRANEWTRDKLACWGLTNAHLEAWGPFGRGWSLKRFSAQLVEPQTIPLISYPNAWSPGFARPLVADVVFLDVKTNADLEKYKGKLTGTIVLASPVRELKPHFEPLAVRQSESNLLWYANAGETRSLFGGSNRFGGFRRIGTGSPARSRQAGVEDESATGTNTPAAAAEAGSRRSAAVTRLGFQTRYLAFLAREGAALVVNASSQGDGGTVFVAAASVPGPDLRAAYTPTNAPRAWATNAPKIPPQITLATEDYNRLARMIQQGEKLKMAVDLQVQFHEDDFMAYNTIAELPGSDLKDEVVMLGAHMDSWHTGTGATDNGAGVAATMEAMRILAALKLQPRRTIRLGLWSGEEQGLFGSKAYVARHFGYYTNSSERASLRAPSDPDRDQAPPRRASTNSPPARRLVREPEYQKLSAYFNLDNGAGKIRGVYMQGNEAVRPLFRHWLEPFHDLDADTLTLSNTSGTDHTSFDAIGLPGFQFIQDPLDYRSRTHHSNEDVLDRIQPDDLKQAAVILAAFAYDAANVDEKLPRKPVE
ncbi:MAG TPA: M20/M25/M40 family metallo-hydrolase [Candidatus Binatia bacterium]|jgi:carboxypeptidase Q|nr:M20/M25/M40 family metallo-hydrolase [Candidatus Binatia bacterium]